MRRRLLRTLVALVALLALWLGGGRLAAWLYGRHAQRVWEERFGPLEAMATRYAPASTSPAALEISRMGRELGVDFALVASSHPRQAVAPHVFHYLAQRLEGEAPDPAEAEQVAAGFAAHAEQLTALRALLLGTQPIAWEQDVARGFQAPVPPLMACRELGSLLVVDALLADDRGDGATADADLRAAWSLADSLRPRGEIVSQLVVMTMDMHVLRGLQRIHTALPAGWDRRIGQYDARRALAEALKLEAWMWQRVGSQISVTSFAWAQVLAAERPEDVRSPAVRWLADPLARPYFLLSMDNTMLVGVQMVDTLLSADACRLSQPGGVGLEPHVPWWNWIGRIAIPSVRATYTSTVHHALTTELTRKVLAARSFLREQGRWPAATTQPSAQCASWQWVSELGSDGVLAIHLEGNPIEPGHPPALDFRASEPSTPAAGL